MRLSLALMVLLACLSPAWAQTITPTEMLRSSVTNFIRPQVKAFAREARALEPAMATLCASPGADTLGAAQAAFAATSVAYGRIEFLRIGPLAENNRAERLLFWPDRRGIGLRQVQQLLGDEDAGAITLAGLQGKSVAVQGLGALEFVLFGTGSEALLDTTDGFRCRYGQTIAQNLAQIADEIVLAWADPAGVAEHLMRPDPAYPDYRSTTESLEAVVGLVAHGIEAVRDTRLNPFIARNGDTANPRQAMFWRSHQTVAMLEANLKAMQTLLALGGMATDPDLADEIDAAFSRAFAALAGVSAPVEVAVADPVQAAALNDLVVATQDLQRLIGEELSATLGLSVGFSSLDGD